METFKAVDEWKYQIFGIKKLYDKCSQAKWVSKFLIYTSVQCISSHGDLLPLLQQFGKTIISLKTNTYG